MAVKTSATFNGPTPGDPVLTMVMLIDKIQRGELRVVNNNVFKQPYRGGGDEFEYALRVEAVPRPLYRNNLASLGPSAYDDVGTTMSAEASYDVLTVRELLDDIAAFREWRDTVRRDRQYAGVAAPPPMMTGEEARIRLKQGNLSSLEMQGVREALEREMLFGSGAKEAKPQFPADWSPSDMEDEQIDAATLAKVERAARRMAARKSKPAEPAEPERTQGARDLILD